MLGSAALFVWRLRKAEVDLVCAQGRQYGNNSAKS